MNPIKETASGLAGCGCILIIIGLIGPIMGFLAALVAYL